MKKNKTNLLFVEEKWLYLTFCETIYFLVIVLLSCRCTLQNPFICTNAKLIKTSTQDDKNVPISKPQKHCVAMNKIYI